MTGPPEQITLEYDSHRGFGSAPTLVSLHGIFMAVLAGVDVIWTGLSLIRVIVIVTHFRVTAAVAIVDRMTLLILGMVAIDLVLSLLGACVVGIAAWKLLRKGRRGAYGWGLAAAIVACGHVWFSYGCVVPLAAGIFGIIVMVQEPTRRYIVSWKAAAPGPLEAL